MCIDLFRIHATVGSASASPGAISPAFDQLVASARRTHLIARVRHLLAYGQHRQKSHYDLVVRRYDDLYVTFVCNLQLLIPFLLAHLDYLKQHSAVAP